MKRGKVKINGTFVDICPPGGTVGVPQTGQTTSYRSNDDGDIQAGLPLVGRFIDNGDGTITDTYTNLMWRKWSMGMNQSNGSGSASTYTWNNAVDLAGDSHAGYSDWRLPNIKELLTLINYGGSSPYTYQSVFPNTANYYWSSSTYAPGTSSAWRVGFNAGGVSSDSKSGNNNVRLVRNI